MPKVRLKDLITEAEETLKNASPEGDARADAQRRLDFLKEMRDKGFTVNQDHINDVVAAETQKIHDDWKEVVGGGLDETKQLMDSISEEDLAKLTGDSGDSQDSGGTRDGEKDGDPSEENVLRLMREGLSERDARIADLEQKNQDAEKRNGEFQKTIMGDRVRQGLVEALRAEGLQDKYTDIAVRNAQYDRLLDDALNGNEPDTERLKEIAEGLKNETGVWFSPERDPNLSGVETTPDARDIPPLTDEMRAAQSTSVF